MSLLDGKYEIISQHVLDDTQTLFEATSPDDSPVTIVWYELASVEAEWAFHHYRQTLRTLRRQGFAAIFDLVSRPGANYVAWQRAPQAKAKPTPAMLTALTALGRDAEEADIRLNADGRPQIYGLSFNRHVPVSYPQLEAVPEAIPAPASEPSLWPQHPKLAVWILPALLGLLGTGLLLASFMLQADNSLVVLPEVVGRNVNEVLSELYELRLAVTAEALASPQAAGQVIAIEPQPGTQLRAGREVTVRYALPPGQLSEVQVPELRGQYLDFAGSGAVYETLGRERLALGRVARIHAEVPRGTVLAQSPSVGSRVPSYSPVDVLISDGPREARTFLPDLRGYSLDEALYVARLAGIDDSRIQIEPNGGSGIVTDQNLAPYTPVSRDLAMLRLSVTPETAALPVTGPGPSYQSGLPNLSGMALSEAETHLRQTGFQLGSVLEVSYDDIPEGVILQNPGEGARLGSSSQVALTVNVRPLAVPGMVPVVERRAPQPCVFPYRFEIGAGVPEGSFIVAAQMADGTTLIVTQQQAGGGDVLADVWQVSDPGPIVFFLTYNGRPFTAAEPLTVRCQPAEAGN